MIRGADLSIVVQGALFAQNAAQIASYCEHWRALFPDAELVLAVSTTDVLAETKPGRIRSVRMTPTAQGSGLTRAAVASLVKTCDALVLAEPALPLPRFKEDAGLNNFNMQLAAAQAGLAQASRRHVLRTRSDLTFLSRDFLDRYEEDCAQPRGGALLLEGRVMISPLFTLDPFSIERMPLHHSDWFHVGALSDVRQLWSIPPITLSDAAHYRTTPHDEDTTGHERLFLTRLAVEQHLMFHVARKRFPQLQLDRHNDRRSLKLCLEILRDNFIVSDLRACACLFEKYASDIAFEGNQHSCITHADWLAMCEADDVQTPLRRKFARNPPDRSSPIPSAHYRSGQLLTGQMLRAGASLHSPSGTHVLSLDGERGLHLHVAGRPQNSLWRIPAAEVRDLRMQADGNLVLYDRADTPLWATDTLGGEGTCLEVTDAGRIELWDDFECVWSSASEDRAVVADDGRLIPGGRLEPGAPLRSPAGHQELVLTRKGALELHDTQTGAAHAVLNPTTLGEAACAVMQDDGNLVAYAVSGEVLWATDTAGAGDVHLCVGDDGGVALCCGAQPLRVLERASALNDVEAAGRRA